MTEQEWLNCAESWKMVNFLSTFGNAPFSHSPARHRKMGLFACHCCRRIWHLLADERSREVVEACERLLDHEAPEMSYRGLAEIARLTANEQHSNIPGGGSERWLAEANYEASCAVLGCVSVSIVNGASIAAAVAVKRWAQFKGASARPSAKKERLVQVSLFRDIIGNPFRPVAINPAWLTWRNATVPKIAQAAYDERELPSGELDRVRLAVLADAREEAGCTNADIVAHLRSPGPHVRGCWVVDLLQGRE